MSSSSYTEWSFDRFDIDLPIKAVFECSHHGQCDADVERWAGEIIRPVKCTAQALADELRDYGAWDGEELGDDAANWRRIIWIAAGNIMEELRRATIDSQKRLDEIIPGKTYPTEVIIYERDEDGPVRFLLQSYIVGMYCAIHFPRARVPLQTGDHNNKTFVAKLKKDIKRAMEERNALVEIGMIVPVKSLPQPQKKKEKRKES